MIKKNFYFRNAKNNLAKEFLMPDIKKILIVSLVQNKKFKYYLTLMIKQKFNNYNIVNYNIKVRNNLIYRQFSHYM